jgi:hypothetical protein
LEIKRKEKMPDSNENRRLKGVVVFFVNLYPELGQDVKMTMNSYKEMSKPLIDGMTSDGRYVPIFAPVHKEATRIEKVDFDSPFPRFNPNEEEVVQTFAKPKKKNKKIFQQQEVEETKEETFAGFITLFINFHPEVKLNVQETIDLIKEINAESLSLINKDGRYTILIVPTTKEGSRVQKVDFDSPFPRFVPKSKKKKSKTILQSKPRNIKSKLQEDEDVEDDEDLDLDEDTDDEDEDQE